jgi:signal peptidase I
VFGFSRNGRSFSPKYTTALTRRIVRPSQASLVFACLGLLLLACGRAAPSPDTQAPAATRVMPAAGALKITGKSMEPTLAVNSVITYRALSGPPTRGQIVVYHRLDALVVGRVVAVPGDVVEVRDGQLVLNGQPVSEPYAPEPMRYTTASREMEARQYYILGDNRDNAADSHITGPVSEDQIFGLVS